MNEKVLANTAIHYWTYEIVSAKSILFLHPAFADHTCFDEQASCFKDYKMIIPALRSLPVPAIL